MATATNVAGNGPEHTSSSSDAVLDVIRRKLGKVQANIESNYKSVLQGILPGKRKSGQTSRPSSLYDTEAVWQPFPEQIEMASLKQRGTGRGHQFVACQLTNPTWCDKCGDFIWGLYKQCQRCTNCQYTCHQNCVPSVTLDCTTVSPGSGGGPVATPTDLPSPSASAETSLTERRTIVNHRSHQQQQQQATSSANSTPSRHLSQPCINVEHVHSGRQQTSSPQNVLLSTDVTHISDIARVTDPLSGAPVLQTSTSAPLLSSSTSASQCVERDLNQNAKTFGVGEAGPECRLLGDDLLVCDATNEKDETDSGYRSGTIPDEKLPRAPSQATLNRRELNRKIQTFNHYVPKAALEELEDGESFQGFIKVTLNLIRPITMELGARPPSIYELLTREHIVEQSTQHIAFYMPRDTVKSIHINSKTTTKEVITSLLKKFHILDNPRKFAMYEQEFNEKNKLVRLRRLTDKDFPLTALLSWDPERIKFYRLVLQENETGEIVWDAFSLPELGNFLQVLDKEEQEAKAQLQYKYRIMRRIILQRLKELRKERAAQADSVA